MLEIITEVLNKIEDNGYKAYIVGGFVRDYYLGNISDDVDICTNAKIDDIQKIFPNIISIDEKYGAITIEYKGLNCEITTFRKDIIYHNNRKPTIEYVSTLEEDLNRRDFTINTLCLDKDMNIIDIFNAKRDIDNKIIKSIGNPFNKIEEDSLRILRAIRFATILNFTIDNELKDAIIEHKNLLRNLSYERKREELDKIFNSDNNQYGIFLLLSLGLTDVLELNNLANVIITNNFLSIWAQLNTNEHYFTNQKKRVISDVKNLLTKNIDKVILYKYDMDIIKIVATIKQLNIDRLKQQYDMLPIKKRSDINIKFNDIKEILNTDDNLKIRSIYDDIELAIINGELKNDITMIKQYVISKYGGKYEKK